MSAKDADGDTYGSAACEAARGTDCDDTNKNVHPGAVEACDGVDNDCNGKADLKDGWTLAGRSELELYGVGDLEWWPSGSRFATVTSGGSGFFGTMGRTTGTNHATVWNSSPSLSETGYAFDQRIVWVPALSTLVLAYNRIERGYQAFVRRIDERGVVSAESRTTGVYVGMAARSGDALIVGSGNGGVSVDRFTGSVLEYPITVANETGTPRIATLGNQGAVIFGQGTIKWFRITAALGAELPSKLTDAGGVPDIASVSNGYAVAWGTASGFDYQVMSSADRSIVCGPVHVATASVGRLAIGATQHGTLVLTTQSGGGQVRLFRFDASCNLVSDLLVDSEGMASSDSYGMPVIAVGGGQVALAWGDAPSHKSKTRIVGEHLCN